MGGESFGQERTGEGPLYDSVSYDAPAGINHKIKHLGHEAEHTSRPIFPLHCSACSFEFPIWPASFRHAQRGEGRKAQVTWFQGQSGQSNCIRPGTSILRSRFAAVLDPCRNNHKKSLNDFDSADVNRAFRPRWCTQFTLFLASRCFRPSRQIVNQEIALTRLPVCTWEDRFINRSGLAQLELFAGARPSF